MAQDGPMNCRSMELLRRMNISDKLRTIGKLLNAWDLALLEYVCWHFYSLSRRVF